MSTIVPRRTSAMIAIIVVTVSLVLAWAPTAQAAAAITVGKSAPAQSLAGQPVSFTLTANNPAGGEPEYNLSYRDELPIGVSYVAGSTSPASLGEPTVITAVDGHQILIWNNVIDLPVGGSQPLTFSATPDVVRYPVGSVIPNTASVYANTDPRVVPRFDAAGNLVSGASEQATSNTTSTTMSAVAVTKSEPSTEHELLRGVHDQSTVYTLRIRTVDAAATQSAVLVDYLPASLEFLGCGTQDNSSAREYPTAPPLTAVPDVSPCVQPAAVETVSNPAGYPAGVYTRVTWNLGTLPAGTDQTISYRAGIPLRQNTMTFPAGAPTPQSLAQQANLDNNTGASTRETTTEAELTNRVLLTGTYTGPVAPSATTAVSSQTSQTVTAEDLALHKTVSPSSFAAGQIATYTLVVRASEYTSGSGIVIRDALPDGLCPLSSTTNYNPANPSCAPVPGADPVGASYASVIRQPDGSFDIEFTPVSVAANGTVTITFQTRMEASYASNDPTVSGDEFLNLASLTGTTQTRPEVNAPDPGPQQVTDTTEAVLNSDSPQLTKLIQPDTGVTPYTCSTSAAAYTDSVAATDPTLTFAQGDRVCFLIRVNTSTLNNTRNPVVTDFLPLGMTFETGSAVLTANNTVPATLTQESPLVWRIGAAGSDGDFVAAGGVFEVRFSAIVSTPAAGPAPDLVANLAKLQYQNTAGQVHALRDQADYSIAAPPPVAVTKAATRVSPTPATNLPDGSAVAGGSTVQYSVVVANNGTAANRNNDPVLGPDVWDALPAGVVCADAGTISNSGVCLAPGSPGFPDVGTALTGRSVIVWDLPSSTAIAAGSSLTLTYRVVLNDQLSVSSTLTNTARVSGFETRANTGSLVPHTSTATDTHTLVTTSATVAKTVTTAINETNNNTPNQATNGEGLTYTYSVRVPAHSSVYNGVLSDPLPAGTTLTGTPATVAYYPDAASSTTATLPAGFLLNSSTGQLSFPATWTNDSATVQLFVVTLQARITAAAAHNLNVANVASFTSNATAGGAALPTRSQTATVNVRRPVPTISKASNPPSTSTVTAGQTVTYTLTAGNANGRPPLHDTFVVDCLPSGLTYVTGSANPALNGLPTAGTGANGCASGTTRLEWSLGDLQPNASVPLTYQATVPAAAGGGATYTNSARISGSTLDDDKVNATDPDNPNELAVSATTSNTISVPSAAVPDKTAAKPTYTVGERARFTVNVTIPANVNYFDTAVTDRLPTGLVASTTEPVLESATCTYNGGAACALPSGPARLTNSAVTGGTLVGWGFGDFTADPTARTLTLVYSTPVADIAAVQAGGALTNSATLRWNRINGTAPPSAGGTWAASATPATATVTVVEPRLTPAKSVSTPNPQPGDTFHYTVTATNGTVNASDAHNVTITDTVPSGVLVTGSSITGGGVLTGAGPAGGGTITWTIPGPVAPGAVLSFGYDARFATPAPSTPLTNTVRITGYDSLPSGGRHYTGGTATAIVGPALPHVVLDKTVVGDGIAYVGEPTTWRLVVTSDGEATAHRVGATDDLPPNWTYVPGSEIVLVNGSPVTSAPVVSGTTQQTLSWTDVGALAPGQTMVITFQAVPQAAATTNPGSGHSVDHVNTATPRAEDALGNSGSAGGSYAGPADTAVAHLDRADLVLDKAHAANPVAGELVTWTVDVRNAGPDAAVGPWTVTDTVPPGLTGATASGAGWSCATVGGTITCTRPAGTPLASGASLPQLTVTAGVPADVADGATFSNSAAVAGRTFESNTANNSDSDVVTVGTRADLAIDKNVAGPVVAGLDATWTVDVRNLGPSVSRAPITVTDTLPAGVVYTSSSGAGWTCTPGPAGPTGQQVDCTLATDIGLLAPAPQLSISAAIPSDRTTAVANSVAITDTTTTDPVSANDSDGTSTVPATSADLDIAKTHVSELVAGQPGTYRFVVANHGPSDAVAVRFTDALPTGVTYSGFTSVDGSWTCSVVGQDLTCSLTGALAADDSATVEVEVDLDPAQTDPVENQATVTSDTPDPVPGNNTDGDRSDVDVEADLRIGKVAVGAAVAGDSLGYELTVENLGPSVSPGPIVVRDPMPAGLTATAASGTGWTCDVEDALVECTRTADLVPGTAPVITVQTLIASNTPAGPLTNQATVDGPADENPTNNAGEETVQVTHQANVHLTKTASTGVAVAGSEIEFELQVGNDGPSDAQAVRVADLLPAGMTAVSLAGQDWSCDLATLTCTLARLAPGDAEPITLRVLIGAGVPEGTVLTNSADVATSTPGDDVADNTDDAQVTVSTLTNLSITKSHADQAVAGEQLTFTVDVANAGPSDAVAPIEFTDTLPAGMSFLAADGGDWTCAPDGADAQQVECGSATPVAAGTSAEPVRITVMISPEASGTLTNVVELAARDDEDPSSEAQADNRDTDDVVVGESADLEIAKTHSGSAVIGGDLAFTITVRNNGPSVARDVVVTDPLPAGLSFESAAGDGWTCAAEAQDVTCTLDAPLGVGEDATPITVTTRVGEAAFPTVRNTATVDSSASDPVTSNDDALDSVAVEPLVNLSLAKSHAGNAVVGSPLTWTLTVTNAGPTPAPSQVRVVDDLPAGLSFVSGTGDGWACSAALQPGADGGVAFQRVSCVRADGLAVGSSTIAMVTMVNAAAYPSVTNTATVSGDDTETTLADNSAADTAAVTRPPTGGTGTGGVGTGKLPRTGSEIAPLLAAALLMIALGRHLTRRRRG